MGKASRIQQGWGLIKDSKYILNYYGKEYYRANSETYAPDYDKYSLSTYIKKTHLRQEILLDFRVNKVFYSYPPTSYCKSFLNILFLLINQEKGYGIL